MFHTMHMSRHPTMLWEPAEVWTAQEQSENFKPQTFMCCFKLETGGFFIGWLGMITNTILLTAIIVAVTFITIFGCKEMKHCDSGSIIFATIMLTPFIISFIAMSYCCIRGTKERDHEQVKSMMVWLGFVVILSFLCVFTLKVPFVIIGTTCGMFFGYLFTVIYSLHDMFKLEHKRDCNRKSLKRQRSFLTEA